MQIYASLGAYFQRSASDVSDPTLVLYGCDRPILLLEAGESLSQSSHGFLIPIPDTDDRLYEIAFPLIRLEDRSNNNPLTQKVSLPIVDHHRTLQYPLYLQDEVFDASQLKDEKTEDRLKHELRNRCDRQTADSIRLFIGLFEALRREQRQSFCALQVLKLPQRLQDLQTKQDANLPLVVYLDRHYQLRHKLELMTQKLRSQLRRTAEMIPLGRIQEMDAYCLRDYVRRPGNTAIEKAGSRQELLGIQREQTFDTPENRFLKGFCDLLHLDCRDYRHKWDEAKRLEKAIDLFRLEPSVQNIQKTASFASRPNYVLQQNPNYRSFYQAYQDFVKRRTEKEKIWGFRQRLATDAFGVLFLTALLQMHGSYAPPSAELTIASVPNYGTYLKDKDLPAIQCFLQTGVFSFRLCRANPCKQGDWILKIDRHNFDPPSPPKSVTVPIWIFWYRPQRDILTSLPAVSSCWCFYWYDLPTVPPEASYQKFDNIHLLKLPGPLWEDLVHFLRDRILPSFGRLMG